MSNQHGRVVFSHDIHNYVFVKNYKNIFVNMNIYEAQTDIVCERAEFYADIEDLRKIFAPDLTYSEKAGHLELSLYVYTSDLKQTMISRQWYYPPVESKKLQLSVGNSEAILDGQPMTLSAAPKLVDGRTLVPVTAVFGEAFGATVTAAKKYTVISFEKKPDSFNANQIRYFNFHTDADFVKDSGYQYKTLWFEEGNRLIPYIVYVPSSYDPKKPMKAVIYFHGGHGDEMDTITMTNNCFTRYCEEYGYLLLSTNGYIQSSFHGSLYPPLFTYRTIDPEKADPGNPEGWSEATLELRRLARISTEMQKEAFYRNYNVDMKNIFACGNSAGSVATMHSAMHDDNINAVSPEGGFVNRNFYDLEKLKERMNGRMLFVVGSEDSFALHRELYKFLDEIKFDYKYTCIGGEDHPEAWATPEALKATFEFFESKLRV